MLPNHDKESIVPPKPTQAPSMLVNLTAAGLGLWTSVKSPKTLNQLKTTSDYKGMPCD